MAAAPTAYDAAAGGPSQAAVLDQTIASNIQTTQFDQGQRDIGIKRNDAQFNNVDQPQLESSLGASGQFYSGAARGAEQQQRVSNLNQNADLSSAFGRQQDDMARQQAFAAMGIVI